MHRAHVFIAIALGLFHSSCGETGHFWHVTDFHYDFTYRGDQWSCNKANKPSNPGQFGDFWCDSPWSLVQSSIRAMANITQDVDFLIWTGDTVLHGKDDLLSFDINADILDNVTNALNASFPNKAVYASFGNHDYWPNNQFPAHNNRLYNDTLERWGSWIQDSSQDESFRKGAYYSVKLRTGLRLIALNTNLYYTSNKAVKNSADPGDQLHWLNATLHGAETSNEKVILTAHIPPGVHTPNGLVWMHEEYHAPLVRTLRKYADVIVAMHFGHDHSDGFKILSNNKGQPAAPIFIAPSVTPWRYVIPSSIGPAHNPGVRLVSYDKQTGKHIKIQQYFLDLKKANKNGIDQWELEYDSSIVYGLDELTPETLVNLTVKMRNSSSLEFQNYWKHYTVSPPDDLLEKCDADCHEKIVCGFTEFEMGGFGECRGDKGSSGASPLIANVFLFTVYALFASRIG